MASVFQSYTISAKSSKPTRFLPDKIQSRFNKGKFLKVHIDKKTGKLIASNTWTGSFKAVVDSIGKNKIPNNDGHEAYYNITLMIAGKRSELEKFLNENLPGDEALKPEDRYPNQYLGAIANINSRWLNANGNILSEQESLGHFMDYRSIFQTDDQYKDYILRYLDLYNRYFIQAETAHQNEKKEKEDKTLNFEQLKEVLGPFTHPETGKLAIKFLDSDKISAYADKQSKSKTNSYNKYFLMNEDTIVKVSLGQKNGNFSLSTTREPFSTFKQSAKMQGFFPFASFPRLYFVTTAAYNKFMDDIKHHADKVAVTLNDPHFSGQPNFFVEDPKDMSRYMPKVANLIQLLESEANAKAQQMRQQVQQYSYAPMMNTSSMLRM